jgi:hypothetical protein
VEPHEHNTTICRLAGLVGAIGIVQRRRGGGRVDLISVITCHPVQITGQELANTLYKLGNAEEQETLLVTATLPWKGHIKGPTKGSQLRKIRKTDIWKRSQQSGIR